MKKIFVFLMLFVAFASSCISQNFDVTRIEASDFDIKTYLKDNIETLDPIEGIYVVSINQYIEDRAFGDKRETFTQECAIIRHGNGFFMKWMGQVKRLDFAVYSANIRRIGETNIYDVKLECAPGRDPSNKIVNAQIELSSLYGFNFKSSVSYYHIDTYTYYDEFNLTKEYPTPSMYEKAIVESKPSEWSGTGFAISNGYLVTNYHVIEDAKTINIKGVKGDMNTSYPAEVVATDKVNDIAVLRITGIFNGFGVIPYAVQQRMADVGEDVFVLGYPLTQALGNEIKLTNGIISSRTGYQGDVSTYQISAPVQPGNSGGPMFDNKGNIIGIVVAGVPGAENVGYAIKTSYLKILIESAGLNIKFPANNTLSSLSLSEKVKKMKDFVFYIECSK